MTPPHAAAVPVAANGRPATAGGFGARLAALARARLRAAAVYLLALTAVDAIRSFSLHADSTAAEFAGRFGVTIAIVAVVAGGGAVLGTMAAEALAVRGTIRVVATISFAFLGAAAGIALLDFTLPDVLLPVVDRLHGLTVSAFVLRSLWYYSATALLFAAYFAMRDRDAAAAALARAAEIDRGSAERAVMESRLKVLQARVEPELLFDVLADARRLYETAPSKADALLDDLIAYLRAALPQMRGESSTLGREAALASAYVKVTPLARDGRLAYAERIPDTLAGLPFPPMVLLPLVQAAADARAPSMVLKALSAPAVDAASCAVAVTVAVARDVVVAGWSTERLAALRDVVVSFFGADTMLDVRHDADRSTAELRIRVPRSLVESRPATRG